MTNPVRIWNQFLFGMTSARPMGAMRIAYGVIALINLAFCTVDLDHWYSGIGLLQGDEARIVAGPYYLSPLHYLQSPLAIRVAFGFTALAALGLTVGWRTKLMSILYYGGMVSIHNRNTISASGADVLLLVFGFNMMLSSCGAAYSVDSWLDRRKRGTTAEPMIFNWNYRLFQFQSSLIYFMAAILKCGGGLWINGSAIHFVLNNAEVRRLDLSFLSQSPILINLMTYSAIFFELSLAFLLWSRAVRPVIIAFGVMLHLGILATINIPVFGELMWVGYLAFLTPPEYNALAQFLDVRRWFQRGHPVVQVTAPIESVGLPELVAAVAEPTAADHPPRPQTIRIDAPSAGIPAPHRTEPAAPTRKTTEREFAAAAMDPHDSFQILM